MDINHNDSSLMMGWKYITTFFKGKLFAVHKLFFTFALAKTDFTVIFVDFEGNQIGRVEVINQQYIPQKKNRQFLESSNG